MKTITPVTIGETKRCLIGGYPKSGHFSFYLKDDEVTEIGSCSIQTDIWDDRVTEPSITNLGYHLDKDKFKNKGYMSEILPKLIEYLFEEENYSFIKAFTWLTNIPSRKLLNKNFIVVLTEDKNIYYKITREEYFLLERIK